MREKEHQENKDNKSKTKKVKEESKKKTLFMKFFNEITDKKEAKKLMFDDMIRLYNDLYVFMDEKERYCITDYFNFTYTKLFN